MLSLRIPGRAPVTKGVWVRTGTIVDQSAMCRPQIAEWVVCTFLALNHRSKSLRLAIVCPQDQADPAEVPKYLENQRKQKWEWDWDSLDLSPEGGGVDDCVSKRVSVSSRSNGRATRIIV